MTALRLEPYVFRILENQSKLQEWLRPYTWNWGLSTTDGLLRFTTEQKGLFGKSKTTVLGEYSVQMLGSHSLQTNTWLWAWANPNFGPEGLPQRVLEGVNKVRMQAQQENATAFLEAREIPIPDPSFVNALAVISTGYMGAFGFQVCSFPGGAAYVAIERCPQAEQVPVSPINKINIITTGISNFELNHRESLIAYLGEPVGQNEDMLIFGALGKGSIQIVMDKQGRIADMLTI